MRKRFSIQVHGIVQGVGFRPFVYNLAERLGLGGWVLNSAAGVFIEIEGSADACASFLAYLRNQSPPLARIDQILSSEIDVLNEMAFIIRESSAGEKNTLISPDMATCDDCLADIMDENNRHYHYPFTNCTNCGPRFTIIEDIPYDRAKTTMSSFPMCQNCTAEFADPHDRRFHAQPNACADCGPRLSFTDVTGRHISGDPIVLAQKALMDGHIVAIKGLGGYHLACDAQNDQVVEQLRKRKYRYDKPFALMVADIAQAKQFCCINQDESDMLLSRRRPIVLLRKRTDSAYLADQIAPGNGRIGIMLPYTPLHHLILQKLKVLVMTSGNISDEPIVYDDNEALSGLTGIAEYFLGHNRRIFRRCDDSVAVWAAAAPRLIRRSRGYAPEPLHIGGGFDLLAVGGEQKNTFCLLRGEQAFVSQHIGDLDNLPTLNGFEREIGYFCRMFDVKPSLIVHDLHPEYLSTKYALRNHRDIPLLAVQHHHAHMASVLAEYDLPDQAIGIIFDGTGYGTDGALWGGEVLLGDCCSYERIAHLRYLCLPGGEAAIREPWRLALSCLSQLYTLEYLNQSGLSAIFADSAPLVRQAMSRNINCPLSSGMGRLFDAVAAIIGIGRYVNYEGQAAVELEQILDDSENGAYSFDFQTDNDQIIIDWQPLIKNIVEDMLDGVANGVISARFHNAVVNMVVAICVKLRNERGLATVVLSGGCWQNVWILEHTITALKHQCFAVYTNKNVPVNDGGLSFGQAAIAIARGGK